MKKNPLKSDGMQSLIASLVCIILGLLLGYIVLLFINAKGAGKAILTLLKNFKVFSARPTMEIYYFGCTLVQTVPLLMCALSILFSYKVGLFNIGCSGQYSAGCCAALYAALKWGWGWVPCLLFATLAGALMGAIVGTLKAYRNVNEVISGIMLNWIMLYLANTILSGVKEPASPYTLEIKHYGKDALIPSLGLGKLFGNNQYVTIAIPISIIIAIIIMVVLNKTKFGYELRATGFNKNAAKYCGMKENRNIILSLLISGGLAGLGAALYYQTGFQQWECTLTSVPAMGFNGIAATFLGGLNPIGTILASYFIQHITLGGSYVDKTMYCSQISDLISAIIIYLCGFVLFLKLTMNKIIAAVEKKKTLKTNGGNN
jgi:general nucleoside transport system permease protein